jgi:tetratricopeptide (TPR) repeat protein
MKLPRRTRAHILEELSVDKFKSSLPLEWLYRTPSHDYGIDGEVEVFDDQGYTTGIRFLVQLKATDETNLSKALRLRMGIKKLNYYKQLNCPLLIVRYLAYSDTIYYRWIYSLNPTTDTKTDKSFSMLFSEKNAWTRNSSDAISDDLKAYNTFHDKRLSRSIKIDVAINPDCALGKYSAAFAARLINSAKENENTFKYEIKFSNNKLKPTFIEINENYYYINLGGVGSFRGVFDTLECEPDVNTLVSDLNVALAFILQHLGHTREAELHFDNNIHTSKIKIKGIILLSYVQCKIAEGIPSDALDFIEHLAENFNLFENDLINEIQMSLGFITGFPLKVDVKKVQHTYETLANITPTSEESFKATIYYNLGNFLSAKNEFRTAIKFYINAAKVKPDYKARAYWLKELAGLFFSINKYKMASKLYTELINIEDTAENITSLADSLIFCGHFEQALDLFRDSIPNLQKRNSVWCLKKWALELLVEGLEIKTQVIGKAASPEFIEKSSEDEITDYIVKTNALCPECWFFTAQEFAKKQEYNKACVSYLLSAFSDESYKETWIRALQCACYIDDLTAFHHIIEVVGSKFGSEAISEFFSRFSNQSDNEVNSRLNEAALQAIQHCENYNHEQKNDEYNIRFGDSNSLKILTLNRKS